MPSQTKKRALLCLFAAGLSGPRPTRNARAAHRHRISHFPAPALWANSIKPRTCLPVPAAMAGRVLGMQVKRRAASGASACLRRRVVARRAEQRRFLMIKCRARSPKAKMHVLVRNPPSASFSLDHSHPLARQAICNNRPVSKRSPAFGAVWASDLPRLLICFS